MKKQVGKIILCLLTITMVFVNFTLSTKATDYDLSQYISQVALEYEKDGSYIAYDQSALADQTKLRFNITAALPKSSLDVNNSIRLTMPDHLALEDTVAPVSAIYSYAGESHDYSRDGPIGSYTVKDHQITVTINNPQDDTLNVYLQINTTLNQLTFTNNNEVTLAFSAPSTTITIKKATETTEAQTNETQTTPKTVKRAPLKANPNTDAPTKIHDNINGLVDSGLSGFYQLDGTTTIWKNGDNRAININNDVTIDLNGNKLQLYDGFYFDIKSGKRLTIIDSQAENYKPTATDAEGVGHVSEPTIEMDTQVDRAIPKALGYYVTEPKVNDTKTKTTDTTKKYTVDFTNAGRIFSETSSTSGRDSTFMIEKGGTLDFKSGVAYNKGPHVVATKGDGTGTATLNLSGGYLIGYRNGNVIGNGNVIWNNAGNVLNISGGVITYGYAENGGGIYNNGTNNSATGGGTINMTGGIITGNEAYHDGSDSKANRFSGGGIYMKSGILNISGDAYITNNTKSSGNSTFNHYSVHGGGGVAADNNSQVNISGGYVTGNKSNEAGGGLYIGYYSQDGLAKLTLTGGVIASNIAETGEGGGIRIGGSGRGVIRATSKDNPIYITNNTTNTGSKEGTNESGGDWGGGGIFIQQNGMLNIMNAIISTNTADGFGAGVSACPTGNTSINTDQGAAIYDNTANGKHYSRGSGAGSEKKNEDYVAHEFYKNNQRTNYQDYFLAHAANVGSYTITNGMLGGGSEEYQGTFDNNKSYEQHYNAGGVEAKFIGLSAHPSNEDVEKALAIASTYISGNHSHNHGGGIMTNGMLTLGESNEIYPSFHVEAYKAFKLKSALDNTATNLPMDNNQFKFAIYKHTGDSTTLPQWDGNEFTAGSGTNEFVAEMGNEDADKDQLGRIYASIPNFLYDNAGDYTFYLVEKDSDDTSITYDHTIYKIQFTVYASGTKIVNNVETTTYSIKDIKVNRIVDGTRTENINHQYDSENSKLTLLSNSEAAFKNTEQSYGLQLTKKDAENGRVLAGAEFRLYQFADNYVDKSINSIDISEVTTLTTDVEGKLTFSSLRGGSLYYLKETKAPNQYQSSGPWVIEVNKDGTAQFYDADCTENENTTNLTRNDSKLFVNKESEIVLDKTGYVFNKEITNTSIKYKLPDTGGSGIEQYYQAAFVLIALGLLVILVRYIKRRVV
ncbi:SpaA isopeptide-forming pilin-related protein [Sharpea azabuensis]|uniref:SpaA isopeptide-forming pilin-related protein n=1 Tax=Sharpea azabuensis TaxID=322505 RepID=UPI00240A0417|nr:SpaA isopeptide-forming pilin-related protein [Sharpea azabuensis]MDD6513450.1 SpaA isopeptide-forming pilin-related protein [Sharpea azabuensis]